MISFSIDEQSSKQQQQTLSCSILLNSIDNGSILVGFYDDHIQFICQSQYSSSLSSYDGDFYSINYHTYYLHKSESHENEFEKLYFTIHIDHSDHYPIDALSNSENTNATMNGIKSSSSDNYLVKYSFIFSDYERKQDIFPSLFVSSIHIPLCILEEYLLFFCSSITHTNQESNRSQYSSSHQQNQQIHFHSRSNSILNPS